MSIYAADGGGMERINMYYIGIDLGGTNIAAGIVDESYKIIKKASTPTKASRPADEIVADMAALLSNTILILKYTGESATLLQFFLNNC